ncbi:MAG: formate dehydrogenase accessory sulfurtransferase FdhD [Lachnospiraceae bacterium]|nr:formate dehydrogenase accessory sulfurtransferase FdhD [Lachnospiraceae bacterium]
MTDLYRSSEVTLITTDGSRSETGAVLLNEHELRIIVNEQSVMKLICTGQHLNELVTGRLLTSGFIESAEDINKILFNEHKTEACVFLNNDIDPDTVKNRRVLRTLPAPDYKHEWIFAMAKQFEKGTRLHDMTSCTHSCMLARCGKILFTCEDIGRHNAMDKAIGYGLSSGIPLSECILYTSGRIPVDMAEKSIAAGVAVLASKSIPTADAVDLAKKYGLVIIGNARPDSMKLFT